MKRKILLLLIIINFLLLFGCATNEGSYDDALSSSSKEATEWMSEAGQHFVEQSTCDLLTKAFGNFFGERIDGRPVILTVSPTTQINRLEHLVNNYNVAFSISNMPRDIEIYLRGYQHPEYGNYYNFVQNYADSVILCPKIDDPTTPGTVSGMVFLDYHERLLYPTGGRIIFLNTVDFLKTPSAYASSLFSIFVLVHEAAHKQFLQLINSGQTPRHIVNNFATFDERHALIAGIELFETILQKPLSDNERLYLTRHYRNELARLREHNRKLRLPLENRERFPDL